MSIKESEKDSWKRLRKDFGKVKRSKVKKVKSDFWVMCKKGMPGRRIPSRGSHKMNLDKKG